MLSFLIKIFIKDADYENPNVRQKIGILSGIVGICFNIFLSLIKFIAALLSGSVSIMADAANNLSDAASSIVTIIGFKLSGQKPDKEHPFGHGRIEYVAGLIVSFFIFGMGIELLTSSVKKIFAGSDINASIYIVIILIISIAVKFYMYYYNKSLAKKISSPTLHGTAKDSISDVVATSAVLLSVCIYFFLKINIDGVVGCITSLLILYEAFETAKDTISPLLGEAPSDELIEKIKGDVLVHDGVLGVHDIVIHNYGAFNKMMSLHVEVPSTGDLVSVHDLIDTIEHDINEKYSCTSVIHMDPVDLSDEEAGNIKEDVRKYIADISDEFLFHDFRIVHHKDRKIIKFDVVVPFDFEISDEKIKEKLIDACKEKYKDFDCDITIDKISKL